MHRPTRTPTHAASTVLALALLGACAAPAPAHKGEVQGAEASTREWGQSDINRVATIAMRENLQALYRLADKLYRRNPAEWRKTAASREAALARIEAAVQKGEAWAPLAGRRDVAALSLALKVEDGLHHTAIMHSQNVSRLNLAARTLQTSIFVKNGPSYAGIGVGGEGFTTFTIATPTGEGTTSARTFGRLRRCVLTNGFSIR